MAGVVEAFGADYLRAKSLSPILYLDVEGESDHPALPQKYYERWSKAICAGHKVGDTILPFRPAVYLNHGDDPNSSLSLNAACAAGAVCVGVSVAYYVHKDGSKDPASPPPPPEKMVWNTNDIVPRPLPIPHGHPDAKIPVLVWQYHGDFDGDIDPELVNPAYEALVMSGTVPAPAPAA